MRNEDWVEHEGLSESDTYSQVAFSIADTVEKLKRIPDRYRNFTEREETLERSYGVKTDLIVQLLDLGMPHVRRSTIRLFDALDLENLGIDLQLASPRWSALQWWARALTELVPSTVSKVISVYAECSNLHNGEQCRFTLDGAFSEHPSVSEILEKDDEFFLTLNMRSLSSDLGDAVRPLIVGAEELTFHLLCDELAGDVGFVADTGLADCRLAALELARIGNDTGVPTRTAAGLFLAAPFPARHSWVQVRDLHQWISLDPFMLSNMAQWKIIDPIQWPPHRSPSALLLETHKSVQPLVYDCGMPTAEHFRTVRA